MGPLPHLPPNGVWGGNRGWGTYVMIVYADPEGWMKFNELFDVTTLFCTKFWNSGPESNTGGRVTWPGYHNLNKPNDVKDFPVEKFIGGNEWLPKFHVPYVGGLVR
ncbi:hypothetical protein Ddye_026821 [Dipteronia dyeriana]|uniref:Pectinesterase catalytic domain-containing protein n=1 Tax=Dipteronia dyeriana TaxID=168575 RepID=A0AAD9TN36_9ROSI|nr:hypothetical protein Ddye_026821 [Dipteronia dyeriana]